MVLNTISTTVMVKLGKVYSNLMVDLKATNNKLRERAKNIFILITDTDYQVAEEYLKKAKFEVKTAIVMYCCQLTYEKAIQQLEENQGILSKVID